jgi:hypothetical protein
MRYLIAAVAGYVAGWVVFYALVNEGDWRYCFEYLRLAWTGQAGERPAFIQLGAVAAAAVAPLGVLAYRRLRR